MEGLENERRIYGPPGCLAEGTMLSIRRGKRHSGRLYPIEEVYHRLHNQGVFTKEKKGRKWNLNIPTTVQSLTGDIIGYHEIETILYSGEQIVYEIETETGDKLQATEKHPFKVPDWQPGRDKEGFMQLRDLSPGKSVLCRNLDVVANGKNLHDRPKRREVTVKEHPYGHEKILEDKYRYKRLNYARIVVEAIINGINVENYICILNDPEISKEKIVFLPPHLEVHHKDFNPLNDHPDNLQVMSKEEHAFLHGRYNQQNFKNVIPAEKIINSIRELKKTHTYDIVMKPPFHNFVAHNFIVHNTGKTTFLMKQIESIANKDMGRDLLLASFTRTAAQELVAKAQKKFGENMPVPENQIGTLHSHCFRALGQPKIAEKHIGEFNEAYPDYAISQNETDIDEAAVDQKFDSKVDETFSEYQILRNQLVPRESWKPSVQDLASKWEKWKFENDLMDFTDMIEVAANDLLYPPHNTRIGIFDEVQDFTPLQLNLIRQWGRNMDYIMIAGDDDQTLFSWCGASPESFLNPPVPDSQKLVLDQSYRVPKAVHALAQRIIERVPVREPKEYKPRDEEGAVRIDQGLNYKMPHKVIDLIEEEIKQDQSVMILGACSYMLGPTIKVLRENGVPFWNPWRKKRGDWNPLRGSTKNGTSTKDRVQSFIEPMGPVFGGHTLWTLGQLKDWIELIKVGDVLQRGGKRKIQKAATDSVEDLLDLYVEVFRPEALEQAVRLDLSWLMDNVQGPKQGMVDYLSRVIQRDTGALDARPKTSIGTIHSVKGGEADTVVLYPDMSVQAVKGYSLGSGPDFDSVIRQFYVGATRARRKLIVTAPASMKLCFKEIFN